MDLELRYQEELGLNKLMYVHKLRRLLEDGSGPRQLSTVISSKVQELVHDIVKNFGGSWVLNHDQCRVNWTGNTQRVLSGQFGRFTAKSRLLFGWKKSRDLQVAVMVLAHFFHQGCSVRVKRLV